MTGRPITLRSPASMGGGERRQPLLDNAGEYSSRGSVRKVRFAEVAGGTTAECAAVCCCCPCGLVKIVVLAVYKVPAGLCRKALRKKRRLKLTKQGVLPRRKCSCEDREFQMEPVNGSAALLEILESGSDDEGNKEIVELEKEMWDQFYATGFWRSSSQRSQVSS